MVNYYYKSIHCYKNSEIYHTDLRNKSSDALKIVSSYEAQFLIKYILEMKNLIIIQVTSLNTNHHFPMIDIIH